VTRLEVGFSARSGPDLLVAAAAELHDLVVIHADKDFDLIASLTGQAVERLSLFA
jgi:predicted nucleic acid-binding protein